ncbi:hypothetical protein KIPB_005422, partial [Kipferlia bialata]|eukprot:g5422.t1
MMGARSDLEDDLDGGMGEDFSLCASDPLNDPLALVIPPSYKGDVNDTEKEAPKDDLEDDLDADATESEPQTPLEAAKPTTSRLRLWMNRSRETSSAAPGTTSAPASVPATPAADTPVPLPLPVPAKPEVKPEPEPKVEVAPAASAPLPVPSKKKAEPKPTPLPLPVAAAPAPLPTSAAKPEAPAAPTPAPSASAARPTPLPLPMAAKPSANPAPMAANAQQSSHPLPVPTGERLTQSSPAMAMQYQRQQQQQYRGYPQRPVKGGPALQGPAMPPGMQMQAPQYRPAPQQYLPQWYYLDNSQQIQGPFSNQRMRTWYAKGVLPFALPVRAESDPYFVRLGNRFCGLEPFSVVPPFPVSVKPVNQTPAQTTEQKKPERKTKPAHTDRAPVKPAPLPQAGPRMVQGQPMPGPSPVRHTPQGQHNRQYQALQLPIGRSEPEPVAAEPSKAWQRWLEQASAPSPGVSPAVPKPQAKPEPEGDALPIQVKEKVSASRRYR